MGSASPFAAATAHAALIRGRTETSEALTGAYLARIARLNPTLHAIVVSNEAEARADARARDVELAEGVLRGRARRAAPRPVRSRRFPGEPRGGRAGVPPQPKHLPIALEGRTLAYVDYAAPFTIGYNTCGNPVLVVPAGRTATGLPIGLQIAAPHYAEPELIRFGTLVEELGAARFVPPPVD
jgi:Asp-tRNA(Asn)/Glu-tRNA(Gln) amidotransferase A subunit family amidase